MDYVFEEAAKKWGWEKKSRRIKMSKLKTLKETVLIEHLTELQQEELCSVVLEWIKKLNKSTEVAKALYQIDWIKHFFNLKDK